MTDRSVGPRCGNNPNVQLTDGDRKAVDDFKARLALKASAKPYIERAVWVDGDPLMEVIAVTVWERCARDDENTPQLVCDDPRTIAAFATAVARAHAAAPSAPADRAALRDRIADTLAATDGWRWVSDSDKARSSTYRGYQTRADAVLAVLPAAACPDPIGCGHEAALGQARETNRRLNYRAQQLESELAAYRRAVSQWEINEHRTYVPLRTLAVIAKAAGRDIETPQWLLHYQRVEQAEAAVERVRSVLESEAVVGRSALDYRGLITTALMADDASGPESPAPDDRAAILREAADVVRDGDLGPRGGMSRDYENGWWNSRAAAEDRVRRMADEAQQPETQGEVVHACPPDGSGVTPCCGRTPFELPRTDRMSADPTLVTCPSAAVSQPGKEPTS